MTGTPPRRPVWPLVLALGLFALAVVIGRTVTRVRGAVGALDRGRTSVTQSVLVEQTRAVARLVTGETTLRDVVTYENSRLGSTKRSLVVVTGKVLTGFDLDRGSGVTVDQPSRTIRIELPVPEVLSVEITELRTYDERSGLWNPFRPADRDTIFAIARRQLVRAAEESNLTEHAEESARRLLRAMVQADGYTTEISFTGSSGTGTNDDAGH